MRCFSSLSLKPVRSSCCGRGRGRGGAGVKLFPPRARRHACSLDEQAAAWSQSSQVSALRGEQLCGAHDAAKWFGGSSGPWDAYVERWRKERGVEENQGRNQLLWRFGACGECLHCIDAFVYSFVIACMLIELFFIVKYVSLIFSYWFIKSFNFQICKRCTIFCGCTC